MTEETADWSRSNEKQLPGIWDSLHLGDRLLYLEVNGSPPSMRHYWKMRELISSLRADVARLELERDALKLHLLAMEALLDGVQRVRHQPRKVIALGLGQNSRPFPRQGLRRPRLRLVLHTRRG